MKNGTNRCATACVCKQNIAEGSAASGTSKETEIKLTNVARATLDELLEDYLDYLKSHGSSEWPASSEKKTAARDFAKKHADWDDWKPLFESRPAETLCNLMIVVIQQTKYLLDRMIAAQEEDFYATRRCAGEDACGAYGSARRRLGQGDLLQA